MQERSFAARWYGKKYGLTPAESARFAEFNDGGELDREVDAWREAHGLPASSSPLSRGYVLDLLKGLPA